MPILLFGKVHYSSRTVQGVFFLDCLTLEDKDITFLRNVGCHPPNYAVSHPGQAESPATPLREPNSKLFLL